VAVLLPLLRQAGLNEYESKAYACLLENGSATAADVSRRAAIPRARVYDVLAGLEKKGFLAQEPSRPVRFKAFHPETALGNLEKTKRKDLDSELSTLQELKAALGKHADTMKKKEEEGTESAFLLSGRQNIEAKFEELLKGAREEAIICSNDATAVRKACLLNKIIGENALKARVSFYSPIPESLRQKKEFSKLNAVEFLAAENQARFALFDNKSVLLFLNHEPKENEKALLVESPSIARYLKETIK